MYFSELEKQRQFTSASEVPRVVSLPLKTRGRPLLLGELDSQVIHTQAERSRWSSQYGCCDGCNARDCSFSQSNTLEGEWWISYNFQTLALSLLNRMNFVKRKGSTSAKIIPTEFEKVRADFLLRIKETVADHSIPSFLIVNSDETGLKLIPESEWTMEKEGTKRVAIKGLDDKREVTAFLSITPSGVYLPPQVLYKGTTERCHPVYTFPADWDIWHSASHWSNETTVPRFIDRIIVPYFDQKKNPMVCLQPRRVCSFLMSLLLIECSLCWRSLKKTM